MTVGLSLYLRIVRPGVLLHWCEGCGKGHTINIHEQNHDGRALGWNGDRLRPSIAETIRHTEGDTVCEYTLSGGMVGFTADCTHELAGKVRPLKEFPLP